MKPVALLTWLLLLAPARAQAPAKPVAVPFELLKSKHMAVMVKINGKGPYRVIFDTGAPISLVNTKVARESGMLGKDAKAPLFSPFGSMGQVPIKTLEVGGLKVNDVAAIVMDHPTVEAIAKALGPIEGIVGFPFFARFKMTLDYQARELTFVPNGFDPPDALEALTASVLTLTQDAPRKQVLGPAAQWGFTPHKDGRDEEAGVTVKDVLPGGAADAAGLKKGDRLLTLDGRWTDTLADTYAAAGHVKAGTAAKVLVRRDGKEVGLTVTPRAGL
jgi:hypothetical protein